MTKLYKISLTLSLLLACFHIIQGQSCDIPVCNENACGSGFVSYTPSGANVFCENSSIVLENNSSVADFEIFYIDWGDGTIDTVTNYNNVSHDYDFQGIDRCETGPIFNQFICFLAEKTCTEGKSCSWQQTVISVQMRPVARISIPDEVCISQAVSPTNNSCNGEAYEWDFGDGNTSIDPNPSYQYNTPGEYTVRLKVTNSCGFDETSQKIKVVGQPEAKFSSPTENLCAPSTIDLIDQSNEFSNTTWNILPNDTLLWCFTDTFQNLSTNNINIRIKQPGDYTIRQIASNVCDVVEKEVKLILGQAPFANITEPEAGCESLTLNSANLNPQFSDDVTDISWTFVNGTPSSASTENFSNVIFNENGKIILRVSNACGEVTDSVDITVFQKQQPSIGALPDTLCAGATPISLIADVAGGSWTSAGTIEGSDTFDPGSVTAGQSYTITYTIGNGTCSATDQVNLFVAASTDITIDLPPIFCENSLPEILTAQPPGGTWQGDHINETTGEYDPLSAGIGLDTVRYFFTDARGCDVSAEIILEVEAFPQISGLSTLDLCVADQNIDLLTRLNVQAIPSGGIFSWSGPGIINSTNGTFNASQNNLAAGSYIIYFSYLRNECTVLDSAQINLTEPEVLILTPLDTTICISEGTLQLSTNLTGGTWKGPEIDPFTGIIELEQVGGSLASYTYEYELGTTCAQSGTVTVDIIDIGADLKAGPNIAICESTETIYMLSGQGPSGGTWEGSPFLDGQTGTVDLTQIILDSLYTFRYCLESQAVSGCRDCATRTFILQSNPNPSFQLNGTACINETFSLSPNSTDTLLNCSWNFGNGDFSTICQPTYSYLVPGNYTINHTTTNNAGCTASDSLEVYVTEPPKPSFILNQPEGCAPFTIDLINSSTGDEISSTWYIAGDTIMSDLPGTIILDSIITDSFFHILLEVSNFCGTVPFRDSVLVHPYPSTTIGLEVDNDCSPFTINLANPTVGNPEFFLWDLGNNTTSTDSLPTNPTYTTSSDEISSYEISLIASNACGADTASRTITVYPPDVEAFIGIDTIAGCAPYIFTPTSFSTPGSFLDWSVISPGGMLIGSSNNVQPAFLLEDPGTYLVILEAARCGADRDTTEIRVLPAPTPTFKAPLSVCVGTTTSFENTSQGISSLLWEFGDRQTSNELNPLHRYDSLGIFTITLTVFSELTDCPASISRNIEVTGLPTSFFSLSDSIGCLPLTINFNNQSTNAVNYLWDFGHDGHTSSSFQPTFTFEKAGNFIVSLVAQDANACFSDTIFETITVYDRPIADFRILNDRFCQGHDSLQLQNLSSADAIQFNWEIEGSPYSAFEPIHWVEQGGPLEVLLVTENQNGCRDTNKQSIEYLTAPKASFKSNIQAGCLPLSVAFNNTSTDSNGYRWIFADGNTDSTFNTINVFQNPGIYQVTLIAQNTNACPVDTSQSTITVFPQPTADFFYTKLDTCGTPARVQFSNTANGATNLAWNFGDNTNDTLPTVEHIYTHPDIYEVSLTAINEFGCIQSTTQEVMVNGNPQAAFELSATQGCAPFSLNITNTSEEALTYSWYLNEVLISQASTPILSISDTGIYDLRLIARYGNQCTNVLDSVAAITVYGSPIAAFTAIPNESPQIKGEVRFKNESLNANRFLWKLGDKTESTEFELEHEYDINGPINVSLFAYQDNRGAFTCVDSLSQFINPEFIGTFFAHNAISLGYGEDIHRVFKPVGLGIIEYDLIIYSPWGEQVWRTNQLTDTQPAEAWDGYYRGKMVPQGVYVWQAAVQFANGVKKIFEGELHVLR